MPEESVMPLLAFTTRPLKLEVPVLKVIERPDELVAFKVTSPMEVVIPSTVIFPLVLSPIIRLPAEIFAKSVEVMPKPKLPAHAVRHNPIVVPATEVRIVVEAVPLLNAVPPIVNPLDLIAMGPDVVKLSFSLSTPAAVRVTAPGEVTPPLVASNVMVPPEEVSDIPEARAIPSPASLELFDSPSSTRFPDELILLSMTSPFVADKFIEPCPVILPPLAPITSLPVRFKEVPVAAVMLPLIRLRSPVIKASSLLLRFMPENPDGNPNPSAPLFVTLRMVALVPVLIDPVKIKSLAVMERALLLVDKAPEMVVEPVPEFRFTVPFAEIEEPPKVIPPAEIFIPLARDKDVPP